MVMVVVRLGCPLPCHDLFHGPGLCLALQHAADTGAATGPRTPLCYLRKDMEISNLEEGRALNSWLIGL